MEVNSQLLAHAALAGVRAPSTRWTGGWIGPRANLDSMKKKNLLLLLGLDSSLLDLSLIVGEEQMVGRPEEKRPFLSSRCR
jgi:hypothetical protein